MTFNGRTTIIVLTSLVLMVGWSGCKKQQTTLEEPVEPVVEQPDTTFTEPEPMEIDTSDDAVFREAQLAAELERKVKETLKPLLFGYNSFSLTPEVTEQLVAVANFLMEYPEIRVLIEGHCDERGSSEYNMGLGENRARTVKEYLENYGVPAIRMEITSWGEENLAQPYCTNEECHRLNRRVEFKVLQK